jgi:hypothetical protein
MLRSFELHPRSDARNTIWTSALADTEPSLSQVYDALRAGQLEPAQRMMDEVLHDHPKSAKAHCVAAEVNAALGNFMHERQELRLAQEPGARSAGAPPSACTGIVPSIATDVGGGLPAGASIVAQEETASHLFNPGEHEVNTPTSEIAQEQHASDHLGGPAFGVMAQARGMTMIMPSAAMTGLEGQMWC